MSNEITTIDTANYEKMAKMMGLTAPSTSDNKSSLSTLYVNSDAIMGEVEVKGKMSKIEVLAAGSFKLRDPDGNEVFSETVTFRPYLTRFMQKRYVQKQGDEPAYYIRTQLTDDLKIDVKDNSGGFNAGRPSGYIDDWDALPEATKVLLRSIKRTRVLLGTVTLDNPVDAEGNEVDAVTDVPIRMEVDNKEGFANSAKAFDLLAKRKRLPIQHVFKLSTNERAIPTGAKYYPIQFDLDLKDEQAITPEVEDMFAEFADYVVNYNQYIANKWNEKNIEPASSDEKEIAESLDIIDNDDIEVDA